MKKIIIIATIVMISITACYGMDIWFASGTTKVLQSATSNAHGTWSIKAARNEFEPFQLVFKNTSAASRGPIDVTISDFTGPGTISSSNVTIFKVGFLNISTASTTSGGTGYWPDPLCPKVDAYYHETRSGCFPLNVAPGWVQPVWFDVFVPADAPPGSYQATVTVTDNSSPIWTGTVNLSVWGFTLPATSSLPSIFTLGMDSTWQGHYGGSWPTGGTTAIVNLMRTYIKAGLRHRLTFTGYPISFGTWNGSSYSSISSTSFQNSVSGFINPATATTEYGLSSLTSLGWGFSNLYYNYVVAPGHCRDGTSVLPAGLLTETAARAQGIASVLTSEQLAMATILPLDEPGGGQNGCNSDSSPNNPLDFAAVIESSPLIRDAGFKVKATKSRTNYLLNTANNPPTNDYIDRWTPYFGSVVGKTFDYSSQYAPDIAAGATLWWYQSCMTHGCGVQGGSDYNGYPQYMVEYPAIYNRIFPWMSFKYGVTGEMYYAVTGKFPADPWHSIRNYAGNGDGTFFYPGVPSKAAVSLPYGSRGVNTPDIGGTNPIPIESIRLKMIREGYEDYEYLKLAGQANSTATVSAVNSVVASTYNFDQDENHLYSARESLANLILGGFDPTHIRRSGGRVTGGVLR